MSITNIYTSAVKFGSGNRTYAVGVAMIVYAILGYCLGKENQDQFANGILTGLGLITLRAGINKGPQV